VSTGGARAAAAINGCTSTAGAHDMIGNVWEWTTEWYASAGQVTSAAQTTIGARVTGIRVNDALTPWPSDYNGDGTWNITSTVVNDAEGQIGIPSAALRGGYWTLGTRTGVFALDLTYGPSARNPALGFRCVVPG
jgi:formylglycine-generating enzyme required for sulfatase activity